MDQQNAADVPAGDGFGPAVAEQGHKFFKVADVPQDYDFRELQQRCARCRPHLHPARRGAHDDHLVGHPDGVASTSPVMYGCDTCCYTWRSTEPAEHTDPNKYPEVFRLKPDELVKLPEIPAIPPLRQKRLIG
jgi:hypothetical protein